MPIINKTENILEKNAALRPDALYFGESQSRVVISVKSRDKDAILKLAKKHSVPVFEIGKVGGNALVIGNKVRAYVGDLKAIFNSTIPEAMGSK